MRTLKRNWRQMAVPIIKKHWSTLIKHTSPKSPLFHMWECATTWPVYGQVTFSLWTELTILYIQVSTLQIIEKQQAYLNGKHYKRVLLLGSHSDEWIARKRYELQRKIHFLTCRKTEFTVRNGSTSGSGGSGSLLFLPLSLDFCWWWTAGPTVPSALFPPGFRSLLSIFVNRQLSAHFSRQRSSLVR